MLESKLIAPRWQDWFWWLYDFTPSALDVGRKRISPAIALLRNLRVPLMLFRGRSHAGTESVVIIAGKPHWSGALARRFFSTEPTSETLGSVPFYRLNNVLREWSPRVDLAIATVDRITARLFDSNYLVVPGSFSLKMSVPENIVQLEHLCNHVRADVRRIRANSLSFEVAYSHHLFEEFFDHYHVPYILNRYGSKAEFINRYLLRRMIGNGGIFWITRDGHRVAGCAYQRSGQLLHFVAHGIEDGRIEILQQGAMAAIYYFGIDYAMREGCTHVEFGSTDPCLNDGLLQYKRKWHPQIGTANNPYVALIHWPQLNEAVLKFLENSPLIFCDGDKLSAITALCCDEPNNPEQAVKLFSRLNVPGLRRFYVVSPSGWQSADTSRMLDQTQLEMVQSFHLQNTIRNIDK